jgi:wyosine [tRNA(Phe)-imidazoG37] synthetase (radical SAM superfamily)
MAEHVPPEAQVIRDIAFSGNGEPTSSKAFRDRRAGRGDPRRGGLAAVPIRLITNGSLVDRPYVQTP